MNLNTGILIFSLLTLISAFSCLQSQPTHDYEKYLDDLKVLSHDSLEGRKTGTRGNALARNYIINKFKKFDLKPFGNQFEAPFEYTPKSSGQPVQGINVVGVHPGTSEKKIVITAHYDHEGIKNGEIYNGADDNASGVVALFALASYFQDKETKHDLVFVAFDAEEDGLRGARAYVDELGAQKDQVLLNINIDMISHNDKDELFATGTYHYPFLKEILGNIESKSVTIKFGHDTPQDRGSNNWTYASDHGPFHRQGIPFVYFGVEDHKDYHKPTDDFENINPGFFLNVLKYLTRVVETIDQKL